MKGLDNPTYLIMLIAFNLLALLFLFTAIKRPTISRILFFLLFAWACWMNWTTVLHSPASYLEYAELSFSRWYSSFIKGWFSWHTVLSVGFIATAQGLIAISLLLRGWLFKIGCIGGIIFLLAIVPLGVGSGFPCTIVFAGGLIVLSRKKMDYLWHHHLK